MSEVTTADPRHFRGDKFRVPRLRDGILIRSRICDRLDEAVAAPVTVITGPAGAGKTIACASWAATLAGSRHLAWLSLDEGDREPGRFWSSLGLAANGGTPPPLVPRSRPGDDQPATAMEETLRQLRGPVVLVLDDLHKLTGGAALADLNFLLANAPDTVRVILSGRSTATAHLARLRLSGDLAEIGAADLACAPAEAEDYLAAIGVTAGEGRRAGLLAYTGGWMGGLKLVVMDKPGGTAVADYLRDEVLDDLPPRDRLVLLSVSVAGTVSAELADALGSVAALDRLSRLTGLPERDDSGNYRLTPVLRDTLLGQLRREYPREAARLLGRAARWLAAHGDPIEAVRCAIEAGDWDYGSALLADGEFFAELPARAADLERLLGGFPAGRRTADPAVAGAFAATRLCQGDPETAAVWLSCASHAAQDISLTLTTRLTALRVMLAGADDETWRIAESSPATGAPAEQAAAGLLWFALGTAALRGEDVDGAAIALGHAERRFHVGMPELLGRARGWRALAQAYRGNLSGAVALIGELRADQPDPVVACLTALAAARIALERGDRATAAALCARADATEASWLPGEPDVAAISMRLRLAAQPVGDAPKLTSSELAVLRLLPGYLTNQEIADELFLSVNTVKTHLKSAYRKLGVTSRRAAISQARHTGLL